jgi:hypothetical protein
MRTLIRIRNPVSDGAFFHAFIQFHGVLLHFTHELNTVILSGIFRVSTARMVLLIVVDPAFFLSQCVFGLLKVGFKLKSIRTNVQIPF